MALSAAQKTCVQCGVVSTLSDFYRKKGSKDGYTTKCKSCVREDNRSYYQKNREAILTRVADHTDANRGSVKEYQDRRRAENRAFLNELKSQPCTDCGQCFPPECMDFDHVPGADKTERVGYLYNNSRDVVLAEVAKCVLRCVNCHRVVTLQRKPDRKYTNPVYERNHGIINTAKSQPCMDCGGEFPPEAMDFDHRPDEIKTSNVAQMRSSNEEDLLAEISKCDVICANCHRTRTVRRLAS